MPDKQIVTCITITKKQLIFPNSLLLLPEIVAHLPENVALFPNSLVYTFKKVGESFQLLPPTRKPLKAQSWQHVYINTCILVFINTWPHIDLYTLT